MFLRKQIPLAGLGFCLLFIFGCAYPISQTYREEAKKDLTLPVIIKNPTAYVGSVVILGGRIIRTENGKDRSKIYVLQAPLDFEGEPKNIAYSQGRFIAWSKGFLDPEIYRRGKRVTVAGEITGSETEPLDKTNYTYPVLAIKQVVFWERRIYPYPYYYWWDYDYWP